MEGFFAFAGFLAFAAGFIALVAAAAYSSHCYQRRLRERAAAWRRTVETAVARVGLAVHSLHDASDLGDTEARLTACDGELELRLTSARHRGGSSLVIRPLAHDVRHALSIRPEGVTKRLEKALGADAEAEIGDLPFDAAWFVSGPSTLAVAVLDFDTRAQLARLLRGRLQLDERQSLAVSATFFDGVLKLETAEWDLSGDRLEGFLCAAVELARRLAAPSDLAPRIAANLRAEAVPGARRTAVATLAREFPNHPTARHALTAALLDADDEVRLRAAAALGSAGHETLLALATSATTLDSCAAQAVVALGSASALPEATLVATLRRALDSGRERTAVACLDELGRRLSATAGPILMGALPSAREDVEVAAARALGRAGTAAAIPVLLEVEANGHTEARRAARQAIAAIQGRLSGAGAGQLSLSSTLSGALSVVDDTLGRVSLSEQDGAGTEEKAGLGGPNEPFSVTQ